MPKKVPARRPLQLYTLRKKNAFPGVAFEMGLKSRISCGDIDVRKKEYENIPVSIIFFSGTSDTGREQIEAGESLRQSFRPKYIVMVD